MAIDKKKEVTVGVIMLGAALGYLFISLKLPNHTGIDAAFVPTLLAVMLCLLAVLQLISVFKTEQAPAEGVPPAGDEDSPRRLDVATLTKTLALILGYIALLSPIGFPIMTALYLYLQFIVLTPQEQKVTHVTYAVIALVTSAATYLLFREAFDLLLPAGLTNF
ncbi:tripartite tricarboxylate transporter TctB family protein [Pseudomonas oryzihabitans]|uniref:tripartite tricarboxylate transporter TctB family protein n=1 Tax=Pseudomonas oryzihabitans TaxID=47885 RepID=UPI003EBBF30B